MALTRTADTYTTSTATTTITITNSYHLYYSSRQLLLVYRRRNTLATKTISKSQDLIKHARKEIRYHHRQQGIRIHKQEQTKSHRLPLDKPILMHQTCGHSIHFLREKKPGPYYRKLDLLYRMFTSIKHSDVV